MSYVSPVYIEAHVQNSTSMGLVISASSVIGILCDFIFARIFKQKSFIFFIWAAIICSALFPISFSLLPPSISIFMLGMAIWGVYYELLQFSDFNFIKQSLPLRSYSSGWGMLSSFKATAYFLGPLIAGLLLNTNYTYAFQGALVFTFTAGVILFFYSLKLPQTKTPIDERITPSVSWTNEIKIWITLVGKIWPVYIFIFLLYLIDSAFWTIGTLLSEQMRQQSPLGGFILPAYSLPTLFMGLIIGRIFPPTGKKRLSFLTASLAGVFIAAIGFITDPLWIVVSVFSASLLLSIAFPEIFAVFEDYVSRLGKLGNDMIGLQGSAISLAYIVGPVIAGAAATFIGNQLTFTLFGVLVAIYSLAAVFLTPKKIRLPQSELQNSQN